MHQTASQPVEAVPPYAIQRHLRPQCCPRDTTPGDPVPRRADRHSALRDQGVAGSNPVSPTKSQHRTHGKPGVSRFTFGFIPAIDSSLAIGTGGLGLWAAMDSARNHSPGAGAAALTLLATGALFAFSAAYGFVCIDHPNPVRPLPRDPWPEEIASASVVQRSMAPEQLRVERRVTNEVDKAEAGARSASTGATPAWTGGASAPRPSRAQSRPSSGQEGSPDSREPIAPERTVELQGWIPVKQPHPGPWNSLVGKTHAVALRIGGQSNGFSTATLTRA